MNDRTADAPACDIASELVGLSFAEARRRRAAGGPNAIVEKPANPLLRLGRHFWAPVPWMLEATIVLQIAIGERLTGALITALLLLNVILSVFQENRASAALALLNQRLALEACVKRDGVWITVPAADLVPGDVVKISLGDVVPADVKLLDGSLLVDQSTLTGESIPVETQIGQTTYAGALVRRGEADARVVATGARTYFGRTAELVSVANVESAEQKAVLGVVRNLTVVNFAVVVGIVAYALATHISLQQITLLVLTAMLSAVPVALPATFTLAAAVGSKALAEKGVLLTRLSALHEAATIDVLCTDKTGTLTLNELAVAAIRPLKRGYDETDVLGYAALASSIDGRDPIDSAIRKRANDGKRSTRAPQTAVSFTPFDPASKTAEATALDQGCTIRIIKGAPAAVGAFSPIDPQAAVQVEALDRAGYRTLAVAAGPAGSPQLIGLIAFGDPPRPDSAQLLSELRKLGVQPVMVTGDAVTTAGTVARSIGLDGPVCPPGAIPESVGPDDFAVYAGVFPEQKFQLVKAFQRRGHAVGMCGDGANDAPALRQAQMGIAVSTATDVAKAAAGVVLTEPGLSGIVACINEGRSAFQRVLTFTLMILVNKCITLLVFGFGLIVTGHAVLTPFLQALAMLTNDFVSMARAADHARPSSYPNAWRVRNLMLAALPLGSFRLLYLLTILSLCWFTLHLEPEQMQTLTFVMLGFAGQGNVYVLRERGRLWRSRPAPIVVFASLCDVTLMGCFAAFGILMARLPLWIIGMLIGTTLAFTLAMDSIKLAVFARVRID
ncbi:MAG TPA: HAD-IC family P-type ATPase [Steroidobacteraceae bacterium]|nr:HAD-IC family P-type ATPase [Steroidobacteraceae bacterium]